MGYLVSPPPKGFYQNIVEDIGPEISDMGVIIHRGTATVKSNLTGNQGFKDLEFPSKGVVERKRHGTSGKKLIPCF
jgi:hypothetical protein